MTIFRPFSLSLLAAMSLAGAAAAQDWADPDYPDIDYSGIHGRLASDNGTNEMFGYWSYGDESEAYDDIDQLVIASNQAPRLREQRAWVLSVECQNGALILGLDHDPAASPRDYALADDGYVDVNYRLDGGELRKDGWTPTFENTRAALYNEHAVDVLGLLSSAQVVEFEVTSSDGTAQHVEFPMAGADEALPKVYEACGL